MKRSCVLSVIGGFAIMGMLTVGATASYAAIDMFLKIGDIQGESQAVGHENEIDIVGWSFGAVKPPGVPASSSDISVQKYVDRASPRLLLACAQGEIFTTATLTVRKTTPEPANYLVIELSNVIVSSYSPGGSSGNDHLTESITLNFTKVRYTYDYQTPAGGSIPYTITWDLKALQTTAGPSVMAVE